jgi:hypothetical protein
MPAQPVLCARALANEILAVIAKEPDLHCLVIQIRGRETLNAVPDDGSGDRESVDLIGLARLTLPTPRSTHHPWGHADDALTRSDQSLLEAARDMPAVLNRPHAIVVEPACPPKRCQMTAVIGFYLAPATNLAGSLLDRR